QPLCAAEPAGNVRAQELRRDDLGHETCHGLVTPEGGASRPLGCLGGRECFSWVCCERDGPFRCAGRLLAACEFDGIDREYRQQHLIDGRLASAVPRSPLRETPDSCGEAPAAYERWGHTERTRGTGVHTGRRCPSGYGPLLR